LWPKKGNRKEKEKEKEKGVGGGEIGERGKKKKVGVCFFLHTFIKDEDVGVFD
jgi:hypothetical protein